MDYAYPKDAASSIPANAKDVDVQRLTATVMRMDEDQQRRFF